ncbi:MAG: hypothetical protein ACRELV_17335, partial [Longimicrobiales bacterium]
YTSFLDIIDLEREDLLKVDGVGEEQADQILGIIESLTVVEDSTVEAPRSDSEATPSEAELAEARQVAEEILGMKVEPDESTAAESAEDETGAGVGAGEEDAGAGDDESADRA